MTAEVIVAPDTAAILKTYLEGVLEVDVAYTVPETRPDMFVSFTITGGGGRRDIVLQDVTISIDSWAKTPRAAHQLASLVEAHLLAAPRLVREIYAVDTFGAPADFHDDLSGQPRFRGTYSLTLRATAL